MPTFEAMVSVQITRQYDVVLQVEAFDIKEAEEKLRWRALGMKQVNLDALVDEDPHRGHYDGEMTVVDAVGEIDLLPEEEEE